MEHSAEDISRITGESVGEHAFLGGARLGEKLANDGVFQEKAEISLCRAMLVTEGVHRAPSL